MVGTEILGVVSDFALLPKNNGIPKNFKGSFSLHIPHLKMPGNYAKLRLPNKFSSEHNNKKIIIFDITSERPQRILFYYAVHNLVLNFIAYS